MTSARLAGDICVRARQVVWSAEVNTPAATRFPSIVVRRVSPRSKYCVEGEEKIAMQARQILRICGFVFDTPTYSSSRGPLAAQMSTDAIGTLAIVLVYDNEGVVRISAILPQLLADTN